MQLADTGYGLDDQGSWVQFPAGAGNFSLLHRVRTDSGAHPASYSIGTGGSFPGIKAAEAWSWPLTSFQCLGQECVALYLQSQIRLHGVVLSWVQRQIYVSPLSTHSPGYTEVNHVINVLFCTSVISWYIYIYIGLQDVVTVGAPSVLRYTWVQHLPRSKHTYQLIW
jgi:hypothetical protein